MVVGGPRDHLKEMGACYSQLQHILYWEDVKYQKVEFWYKVEKVHDDCLTGSFEGGGGVL